MAAVSSPPNIDDNSSNVSVSVSRITTDIQGPTGSIEWVIDHFNHLDDTITDERDSKRVKSPIFVACGHRWEIHLCPSFRAPIDRKDETKGTDVYTGVYLFLAPEESKDIVTSTTMTIKGLNGALNGSRIRATHLANGAQGRGTRRLRSAMTLTRAPDHQLSICIDIAVIHQPINGQLSGIITTPMQSQVPALIDAFHQLLTTGTGR